MDLTVDPCDDFYQFACGKFLKDHANPDKSIGTFNLLRDRVNAELRTLFDGLNTTDLPQDHPFAKVDRFYNSCMKSGQSQNGLQVLFDAMDQAMSNSSLETKEGRTAVFAKAQTQNVSPLFKITAEQDVLNATDIVIYVSQPELGMRVESYENEQHMKAYSTFANSLMQAVFNKEGQELPPQVVKNILDFETALARGQYSSAKAQDDESIKRQIDVSELDNALGKWVDFSVVFKELGIKKAVKNVVMYPTDYFQSLSKLLESTSADTLEWYTRWTYLRSFASFLPSDTFWSTYETFRLAVDATYVKKTRQEMCIQSSDEAMGLTMGELMFSNFKKDKIEKLISFLRIAFKDIIGKTVWLDDETREKAIFKLQAVNSEHVAFPDFIHVHNKLEEFYKELEVSNGYLENAIKLNEWGVKRNIAQYENGKDKDEWITTPVTVNAFYVSIVCHIVMKVHIHFFDAVCFPSRTRRLMELSFLQEYCNSHFIRKTPLPSSTLVALAW
jgi:endothelin-converting enzyme